MSTKGILKAGDKLQTNLTGASNYDLKVGGINLAALAAAVTLGPYDDDQFYELTVNSGIVSVSCYDALINGVTPSVALADLGSAQSAGAGAEREVTDQAGRLTKASDRTWIDITTKRKNASRVIPFGSSSASSQQGPITSGADRYMYDLGVFNWLNAYCDGRFSLMTMTGLSGSLSLTGDAYGGVHGQQSPAMLARIYDDAIKYAPDIIYVIIGANDFGTYTSDQTISNLKAMYDIVLANGIDLWTETLPPRYVLGTVSEAQYVLEVNEFIRNYCRTRNGAFLVGDKYSFIVDATSITGAPKSGYMRTDNIHLSPKGLRVYAKNVADRLKRMYPDCTNRLKSAVDIRSVNQTSKHLLKNPLLTGTTGTAGTGASGVIPTGWQAYMTTASTGSIVSSVAANSEQDGVGSVWTSVCAATVTGAEFIFRSNDTTFASLETGKVYEAEMLVKLTGMSGISVHEIWAQWNDGVSSRAYFMYSPDATSATKDQSDFEQYISFKTPRFSPDAACTSFNLHFRLKVDSASGGATIAIKNPDLRIVEEF